MSLATKIDNGIFDEVNMPSATIKIFLVHGDPKRLRTAEISNWTGKALACPRSEFEDMISREESSKSGIYFLTGIDPESGKSAIYIGEAEVIKDRIKSHFNKDFWNHIAFFICKDENLTKAHVRYLEGRLIEQARTVKRSFLVNNQSSGARLPESDREDMEVFLNKINQLLPVLGIDLLVPAPSIGKSELESNFLFCEIKGITARGYRTPNGFIVLKGSHAVLKERASSRKYTWPSNMR
ncbi:hypothetical protein BVY01_01475, partial [bacterium I07]